MKTKVLAAWMATSMLAGCGGTDPVTRAPQTTAAPAVAATTGPVPSATVAVEPSNGPGDPTAAAAAAPSPFVAVAQYEHNLRVHAIDGALLVSSAWVSTEDDGDYGLHIGVVRDGAITWQAGLRLPGFYHEIVAIEGQWPDRFDLLATGSTGRTGIAEHWTIRDGKLVPGRSSIGQIFVGLSQVGGGLVALSRPVFVGTPTFHALRAPARRYPFTPLSKKCPEFAGFGRRAEVNPVAFAGTRDGTLISLGSGCEHDVAAEIWEPGKPPRVVAVPIAPDRIDNMEGGKLLLGKGDELWFVSGNLAHFDGTTWRAVDNPSSTLLVDADTAPDGTLWAADEGAVYRHDGQRWTKLPLPPKAKVTSLAVDDRGVAWVASGTTLLRHGGKAPAQTIVIGAPGTPERARPKLPRAGSPRCAANLVVLYGFTKVTPDDYDFPMTRKAVAGHWELKGTRFFVTKDLGTKFFVAKPPSYDVAVKLQALVAKKVKGAKPQVVCADPEIVRELKVNLATGAVQP
jgi:hypothetical protein